MTPEDRHILLEEEGEKRLPSGAHEVYRCSRGFLTVGHGWNLDARGLPDRVVRILDDIAIQDAEAGAQRVPGYLAADPVRQAVIVRMCYQMGLQGVLNFKRAIAHFAAGAYAACAQELRDSKWWRIDSPQRAEREARRMETGLR